MFNIFIMASSNFHHALSLVKIAIGQKLRYRVTIYRNCLGVIVLIWRYMGEIKSILWLWINLGLCFVASDTL